MNDPRFLAFGFSGPGRGRKRMDNFGKILGYVCAFGALIGIVALASTCAPGPEKAVETLRVNGFTDIRITGTDRMFAGWSGCSDKDGVAHHATATNPRGERVTLTVCCGTFFKGCTVRVP